jgi:hypothetical protein
MARAGYRSAIFERRNQHRQWRIRARSNITSRVLAADLRQILLVLPRQAREPDRGMVPFGTDPAPLTGRGIGGVRTADWRPAQVAGPDSVA